MSMSEDIARAKAAGLNADHHWWERSTFIRGMEAFLERLKVNENAKPCLRFGLDDKGVVRAWFYIDGAEQSVNGPDGDDCEPDCFDLSHPCPPFC